VMTILVIVLGVIFFLNSDRGNKLLYPYVNETLSNSLGYRAEIEGIKISFPLKIQIRSLQLADNTGVWLRAENNQINISPPTLSGSLITVSAFSSSSVDLMRFPETMKEHEQVSNTNLPDVVIGNIFIEQL